MTVVRDIMTADPILLDASQPVSAAAKEMARADIGNVLVEQDGVLRGILTDRDIVIRGLAEGKGPEEVTVGDLCSTDLLVVGVEDDAGEAIEKMFQAKVRRVPVMEEDVAVGVLSIGDLAERFDRESLLGVISAAPPQD